MLAAKLKGKKGGGPVRPDSPQPLIFILTAPSGGGKTTVIRELKRRFRNFFYSVSATTRPRRKGERNRYDYIFLTRDEFLRRKERNEFLEVVKRYGNYYGTPREPLLAALRQGRNCLMDLEPIGAQKIKRLFPREAVTIFLRPPSQKELFRRLARRLQSAPLERSAASVPLGGSEANVPLGGSEANEITKRIATDRILFSRITPDYSVLNKDLKETVNKIARIIKTRMMRAMKSIAVIIF